MTDALDLTAKELLKLFRGTLPRKTLKGLSKLELDRDDQFGALYAECIEAGLNPDQEFERKGISQWN